MKEELPDAPEGLQGKHLAIGHILSRIYVLYVLISIIHI